MNQKKWTYLMLFSRITLFIGFQALLAGLFYLLNQHSAWDNSEKWWSFIVSLTNVICLVLLIKLFKQDGKRFWDLFRIRKDHLKKDLKEMVIVLIIALPLGFLPNVILSNLLYGNIQTSVDLLVRPIPYWAAIFSFVIFPITQGLGEIPTYFSYVMPKLKERGTPLFLAIGLPIIVLSLQHLGVPLIFSWKYIIWRGLMFLPFATVVGIVIHLRPRLLPYIAIVHVIMDVSFAIMFLPLAY